MPSRACCTPHETCAPDTTLAPASRHFDRHLSSSLTVPPFQLQMHTHQQGVRGVGKCWQHRPSAAPMAAAAPLVTSPHMQPAGGPSKTHGSMNLQGTRDTCQLIPAMPTELFPTAPTMPAACVPCPMSSARGTEHVSRWRRGVGKPALGVSVTRCQPPTFKAGAVVEGVPPPRQVIFQVLMVAASPRVHNTHLDLCEEGKQGWCGYSVPEGV